MKRLLMLAIMASLLLTACSESTISKEEAMTILKTQFKEDCVQRLSTAFYKSSSSYNTVVNLTKKLEKEGYLKVNRYGYGIEYFPTGKAKAYRVSGKDYRVATSRIEAITAIAKNEDGTATVLFTYSYENLPLFPIRKLAPLFNGDKNRDCNSDVYKGEVVFKKFDTGWKIQ